MSLVYPGSTQGITSLKLLYHVGDAPVGDVDVPGERATARAARLLHEGAHESLVTAKLMEERLRTGAEMMETTLNLMTEAAAHKSKFMDAVYKIRELVEDNPDFQGELRDVLAPVRAVIRADEDGVDEDDEYEGLVHRPAGGGVAVPPRAALPPRVGAGVPPPGGDVAVPPRAGAGGVAVPPRAALPPRVGAGVPPPGGGVAVPPRAGAGGVAVPPRVGAVFLAAAEAASAAAAREAHGVGGDSEHTVRGKRKAEDGAGSGGARGVRARGLA
jgi:hypothetical protein